MSANDVIETYIKLHQGKVGQHWLWAAIERVVAGDDEAEVMRDFGFSRTHYLNSLQSDLQGMFKCYWGLRELFDQKAGELAKATEQRDDLLAALEECRSSVKFDLIHYEKMARAYGNLGNEGRQTHEMAESEANRLHKLMDTIDALAKVGAGETAHNDITQGSEHSERPAGAEG